MAQNQKRKLKFLLAGPFITSFAMANFGIANGEPHGCYVMVLLVIGIVLIALFIYWRSIFAGFPIARLRSEISTSPIF